MISNNYLLDDIRNNGLKDNKQIREDNIEYSSIDFGNGKKCLRISSENNKLVREII